MNKTARVAEQELRTSFGRVSYLIVGFGLPLLLMIVVSVMILLPFDDEAGAKRALEQGEISAYYLVPPTYLASGEIFYVYPPERSLVSDGQNWVMSWTLMFNLAGGDFEAARRLWNPVRQLEESLIAASSAQPATGPGEACARPNSSCQSNELVRLLPSLMVVLFFISFMVSGNMLFQAVGTEKENRTLEVLLLSISPRQMLAGKTIALGLAGLLQMIVWLAAVYTAVTVGGSTFKLPEGFTFPLSILVWSLLFFLGGFAVYASLMAGAGALASKLKEATTATYLVMSPLFIGYVVGILAPVADAGGSMLPVILSIFPLTAPVVMIMRLVDGTVPTWQLLLSLALLLISALLVLRLVASMFRAQVLLSGQPFSLRRYFLALRTS
jgi:ABC-2 type transport system permease protein